VRVASPPPPGGDEDPEAAPVGLHLWRQAPLAVGWWVSPKPALKLTPLIKKLRQVIIGLLKSCDLGETPLNFLKAALDLARPAFKLCRMARSCLPRTGIDFLNPSPIGNAVPPRRWQFSIEGVNDLNAMQVIVPTKLLEPGFNLFIKA
jgi:hypothetical protein